MAVWRSERSTGGISTWLLSTINSHVPGRHKGGRRGRDEPHCAVGADPAANDAVCPVRGLRGGAKSERSEISSKMYHGPNGVMEKKEV